MSRHRVAFASGRVALVEDGATIRAAAESVREPIAAECGGRGACGRCLVRIIKGDVPEYRIQRHDEGRPVVLACVTPVHGSLRVQPLVETALPKLPVRDENAGTRALDEWAPWPLALDPLVESRSPDDLGVALDVGTTTLRLLLVRLSDGIVVGESAAYNPQIPLGADVISRIVAAEKGRLDELASAVRSTVLELIDTALASSRTSTSESIRLYVVAGNLTMTHLLLGIDPSPIRNVPSQPKALSSAPIQAGTLGWPGAGPTPVHTIPAAGGWVGGDIIAGIVRAGFPHNDDGLWLYVDLGTNGEIAVGGRDFAMACACSAGPAFEGGGITCGMRADRGAIDGVSLDVEQGKLTATLVSGARARGICGGGLISLADTLFRAGWIDRRGAFTSALPERYRIEGRLGKGVSLSDDGRVALWERDLSSLLRTKGAIFAGIRTLIGSLGEHVPLERIIVSGNFGRFLNLPAAIGIGLLPDVPLERYTYVDNGSLEGATLVMLSRPFLRALEEYLSRVTYIDLADLPAYIDEFTGACFLPHTSPERLRLG